MIELAVVIPTFNERDNLRPLLAALERALAGIAWEAVVVDDDSPDGTADLARSLSQQDPRVRVIQRVGRRGLSSACVEGMMATAAPFVAVIDADMQHDEGLLPAMLAKCRDEGLDIVVGSRYVAGGGIGNWDSTRALVSRTATRLSRLVIRGDLSDPMSGFFLMRRTSLMELVGNLSAKGFKILADIFASSPRPLRFAELPYQFRTRHAGESKLDTLVAWEYVLLLSEKLLGGLVPFRFVMFVLVGAVGVLLHLALLGGLLKGAGVEFATAQAIAILVAIALNFTLNNLFTYRDRRLKGWRVLEGLASFALACAVGAFVNLRVAIYLFDKDVPWWLAGLLGAGVGAVWNFAVTSTVTWRESRRRAPRQPVLPQA